MTPTAPARPAKTRPAIVEGICVALFWLSSLLAAPSYAAERSQVSAFLEVTGFDVAIASIAQSAGDAPGMLGAEASDFGLAWERLASDVFDPEKMQDMAVDILEQTLSRDALLHAAEFYASDLGQRLVEAENISHQREEGESRLEIGEDMVAEMQATGDPRISLFHRMNTAIGGTDSALRAVQEIQFRFLMAASAAGLVDMQFDADGLRAMMKAQEDEMRRAMNASNLAHSAYTYRDFSVDELRDYVAALEDPVMQEVYALLNAVQYEIQANRFEELAHRMRGLQPVQEL